ncbi:laminin subunit alpha-1-like [Microtus pennsylvanicus]|uniref:laminin subunit alpha-1-like n=1 Tax=Microtus pennsylvanicus TaxID=10058 RepID=UPI003F6B5795
MMAGDPALCWLLVCPAVATTTVMSVTWKLGSVWAAKELLSRIQKRFQKPQEKLKALKEAASGLLSNHSEELQAAEELLREAETKTQESNGLLLLLKASLREFGPTTQVWKS